MELIGRCSAALLVLQMLRRVLQTLRRVLQMLRRVLAALLVLQILQSTAHHFGHTRSYSPKPFWNPVRDYQSVKWRSGVRPVAAGGGCGQGGVHLSGASPHEES